VRIGENPNHRLDGYTAHPHGPKPEQMFRFGSENKSFNAKRHFNKELSYGLPQGVKKNGRKPNCRPRCKGGSLQTNHGFDNSAYDRKFHWRSA
jgi:hypothetical protein